MNFFLPSGFGDDHFRFIIVKLVPKILGFQDAIDVSQFFAVAFVPHSRLLVLPLLGHRGRFRAARARAGARFLVVRARINASRALVVPDVLDVDVIGIGGWSPVRIGYGMGKSR